MTSSGPLCIRCDELGTQIDLLPAQSNATGAWSCPQCGQVWIARRGGSISATSSSRPSLVWRLHGPAGTAATCWMRRAPDGWSLLTVYQQGTVSIFERHLDDAAVLDRCAAICSAMHDDGWIETMH